MPGDFCNFSVWLVGTGTISSWCVFWALLALILSFFDSFPGFGYVSHVHMQMSCWLKISGRALQPLCAALSSLVTALETQALSVTQTLISTSSLQRACGAPPPGYLPPFATACNFSHESVLGCLVS